MQKINVIVTIPNQKALEKRVAKAAAYAKKCLINRLPEEKRYQAYVHLIEHERRKINKETRGEDEWSLDAVHDLGNAQKRASV
ncbi:hypothetical protein [Sporosalibacterium faouarense]|uniref:hypothetical protein n=1 Tax=Sporosalibacterium faouarense TaxID=516123 RepID=UPI00192C8EA2|nr:hypothetical protein [Sporosalibacterium faouarense]